MIDDIVLNKVSKKYLLGNREVDVLKEISFSIRKGEFCSIMGPSGSGKSTLLYLMAGLDKASSGQIEISGKDLSKMNDKYASRFRLKNIGFIFQFYNLIQNLSVEENIMLPLTMSRIKIKQAKTELKTILNTVDLYDKRRYMPNQLSGGQQQRVAIARAVITRPKVILADEPTGNLDSNTAQSIMELFKKINVDNGITIVQVTHSQEYADYANRIIYLKDGWVQKNVGKNS